MAFVRTTTGGARYASPGELYRDLPRRPGAVPGLWAHQSEMLKAFASKHNEPDMALELPTGTGKTLTGLLIAEWTRHSRRARVVYACPTQQLARQVADAAHREGIDTALLIGSHTTWPVSAHTAYEAANAIAITTYSTIFNSNPQLTEADLILFDDAHAGEQYVGEAYSVEIDRRDAHTDYQAVLNVISPAFDGRYRDRLLSAKPDPGIGTDVRLVVPLRQTNMVEALDDVLGRFSPPQSYRYSMIRSGLASCLVYVAYSSILIRPYIPPTHQNRLFSGARQRIYLSATLGEGGELERAFGRTGILRLKQPDESTAPRYGRRFFVFPDFVEDADSIELSQEIVAEAGKALILAPQTETAMNTAKEVAQAEWPVWGIDQVSEGMSAFAELDYGTCGLAARYDGLDLPGKACQLVGLKGIPGQDNLQEKFLQSRVRAGAALASRVRTRVVQGAGRCTRGPGDTAVVLVLGSDLSRYLTRPEVTAALDSELQAELRFGRENSQHGTRSDVLSNIQAFLHQDTEDEWRTQAEPTLADYRREMLQKMPAGTSALSSCVENEIQAWEAAAVARWSDAAHHAHEVARLAGSGGLATKGYRAFWTYLEAVWSDQAADQNGDTIGRATAQSLVQESEKIMGLGSWIRQMAPFPTMERFKLNAIDALAVQAIATQLEGGVNQGKMRRKIEEIKTGLQQSDPGQYEPALTKLGELVGATASKPTSNGRCDSTWCWGNELWLALEAKSDHKPTGVVSHKDIRQANDQLRLLANDCSVDVAPPDSATIIITPKPGIHNDGIIAAESHVHVVSPPKIASLALDVETVWNSLLTQSSHKTAPALRQLVSEVLHTHGVLPSQIHERLTYDSVASLNR